MSGAGRDTGADVGEQKRSSRDLERVRGGLERAVARHVADGTDHRVSDVRGTSATGMSSETLLFEADWTSGGRSHHEELVARVAPDPDDVPVFPDYDLPGQFQTIRLVSELSDVPVPEPLWCEPGAELIGAPFFVMRRVDGEVPPDVMPYAFGDNWLFDATADQQARLMETTVSVLARLHAIDKPEVQFSHLARDLPGDTPLRRHVAGSRRWYEFAAADCGPSDLVEKGFAWLDRRWPAHEGDAVFNWGDARIGNVMYRDFEPIAVLDWEMAGLGPRELDLAWLVALHRMFEGLAAQFGMPGMPDFLRVEDVAATYERLTGHTPADLDWYLAYSALQMGIVFLRTGQRSVHFGDRAAPENADELLMNAPELAALFSA